MKYWSEFEEIRIGFSIDGMGKELEYMRNPVKWKHILKNIDIVDKFSYDNLPDKWNGPTVYDVVTVSIYNVLHIIYSRKRPLFQLHLRLLKKFLNF